MTISIRSSETLQTKWKELQVTLMHWVVVVVWSWLRMCDSKNVHDGKTAIDLQTCKSNVDWEQELRFFVPIVMAQTGFRTYPLNWREYWDSIYESISRVYDADIF